MTKVDRTDERREPQERPADGRAVRNLSVFLILGIAALTGFAIWLAVPARFPGFGLSFPLAWADQILGGTRPDFSQITDTPHPLGNLLALALAVLPGPTVAFGIAVQAFLLGLFVTLAASIAYVKSGKIAASLVFLLLITRGNLLGTGLLLWNDTIFACLVLAAWHAWHREQPIWSLAFLAASGLQRPEGWVCTAVLACCMTYRDKSRFGVAGLATAAPPVLWLLHDQALTGEWLFSLTHTSAYAQELNRLTGLQGALSFPDRVRDVVGGVTMLIVFFGLVTLIAARSRVRDGVIVGTVTVATLGSIVLGAPAHGRYFLVLIGVGVAYGVVGLFAMTRSAHESGLARSARLAVPAVIAAAVLAQMPGRVSEIKTLRATALAEARVWNSLRPRLDTVAAHCTPLSVNSARIYTAIPLLSSLSQGDLRVIPGGRTRGFFHADADTLGIIGFETARPTPKVANTRRGWAVAPACDRSDTS